MPESSRLVIRRLLVANRGVAARRVFATCRSGGVETVAVYSDADAGSPHVAEADWAVHLPGNAATATYLRGDLLVSAARKAGADAVHPGWGYLDADPAFAAAVADAGLTWVGPPSKTLAAVADPPAVTGALAEAGIPVAPRLDGTPAGAVRHLQVTVLVDAYGNTLAFGERECSIQRAGAPLLSETPSSVVTPELREELIGTAVRAVTTLGLTGAATVELSVIDDGHCQVRQVQPRLIAEHAVTENAAGLDLVRLQLVVAEGGPLPLTGTLPIRGHTIGMPLRAEDPAYAWRPTTGTLHRFAIGSVASQFRPPSVPGLRLDSGVAGGGLIGTHYDSALAMLTAWAPTRYEAARLLAVALTHSQIHGVATNRDLLVRVVRHPAFLAGAAEVGFLDRHPEVFAPLLSSVDRSRLSCLAAALAAAATRRSAAAVLGTLPSGWRNAPSGTQAEVYAGPMGTVEVGYRMDRDGALETWWVRGVDPDELDLAGLGEPNRPPDDHPPVAVVSAQADRVLLDVTGVRLSFSVHRVGPHSYVDSGEGSVTLTEFPRYRVPAIDETPD